MNLPVLDKQGTISVNVTSNNNPVKSVNVTLTNTVDEDIVLSGVTGSAGGCNIKNVKYGVYKVEATCDGYTTYINESYTVDSISQSLKISLTVNE